MSLYNKNYELIAYAGRWIEDDVPDSNVIGVKKQRLESDISDFWGCKGFPLTLNKVIRS